MHNNARSNIATSKDHISEGAGCLEQTGPSPSFLDFDLDSRAMVIWLPLEKLRELQSLVRSGQVQEGGLNYSIVRPGKARQNLSMEDVQTHTEVTPFYLGFQPDLKWWETLIS